MYLPICFKVIQTHSQIRHYFFSYLLTWEIDLIEILEIMLQMCHNSILITQGSICEIFGIKFRELAILKTAILKNWPFWKIGHFEFFFFKKIFFLCFILIKISPNLYDRLKVTSSFILNQLKKRCSGHHHSEISKTNTKTLVYSIWICPQVSLGCQKMRQGPLNMPFEV